MDEYPDDPSIGAGEVIWRRIPPDKVQWDEALGRYRPQTGMFSDSRDRSPMSAARAKCYQSHQSLLRESGYPEHLLVAFRAGDLRSEGLQIATLPRTDDPGHVWIVGKKTARVQRGLARSAEWVVSPPSARYP